MQARWKLFFLIVRQMNAISHLHTKVNAESKIAEQPTSSMNKCISKIQIHHLAPCALAEQLRAHADFPAALPAADTQLKQNEFVNAPDSRCLTATLHLHNLTTRVELVVSCTAALLVVSVTSEIRICETEARCWQCRECPLLKISSQFDCRESHRTFAFFEFDSVCSWMLLYLFVVFSAVTIMACFDELYHLVVQMIWQHCL